MSNKFIETRGSTLSHSRQGLPLSSPKDFKSEKNIPSLLSVRSPRKISRRVRDFFKINVQTGAKLSGEQKSFLAQVLMHELDEGARILQVCGEFEKAQMMHHFNHPMHLSQQVQLLRSWLEEDKIKKREPEWVQSGNKIRNNQIGSFAAALPTGPLFAFSSEGILYKDRNEDALLITPQKGVLAVLDGMGGHIGGNIASGLVVDFLEYALFQDQNLEQAIFFANEALLQRVQNDPTLGGSAFMGTTLVCAQIQKNKLRCLNIGDSKCVVIRQGKVCAQSRDHTNGQDLLREGLIDQDTAHQLNHILSRCLGQESIIPHRDLEGFNFELKKGDRVLLLSDGITDNFYSLDFSLQDLARIASHGSLEEAVQKIYHVTIDRVRKDILPTGKKAKPDNLTVVLYEHQLA